jgi:hypothetical protein
VIDITVPVRTRDAHHAFDRTRFKVKATTQISSSGDDQPTFQPISSTRLL